MGSAGTDSSCLNLIGAIVPVEHPMARMAS